MAMNETYEITFTNNSRAKALRRQDLLNALPLRDLRHYEIKILSNESRLRIDRKNFKFET